MSGNLDAARRMLNAALAAGADEADLRWSEGRQVLTTVRLGAVETVKVSSSRAVQLRVIKDRAQAVVSATEREPARLEALAAEAVALAALSQPDEFNRLPEPELYARTLPDLDLFDTRPTPDTAALIEMARSMEAKALGADPRIENSQGSHAARSETHLSYLTSNGFEASFRRSGYFLALMPVARDKDGELVTEHWGKHAPHLEDMADPEALGAEAARRVLRRLEARRAPTGIFPVLFESRVAARVLGLVFGCLAGSAVWRKRSYLAERLGERVASESFTLVDEPHRIRGLGSRPCDGEGLPGRRLAFVDGGVLAAFATDLESSRRLGQPATGHGVWGGGVAPSNLYLEPGASSLDELVAATERGLLVINTMGQGFQAASGHWSQGCVGLWIEGGALAYPVREVTIAGTLDKVLGGVDRVADDLDFSLGAVASPSFRVSAMTVGSG